MNFETFQETLNKIAAFDYVRAFSILANLDEIFDGRDNYTFEVTYPTPTKPGLSITYNGVSIFFNCYNPC